MLLIVVFYSNTLMAQSSKNVFDNYYNWGVTVQVNNFSESKDLTTNNNINFSYELTNNYRAALGLTYNVYKYKSWNFKVDLQLQWFGDDDLLFIGKEETILPFDFKQISRTEHEQIAYLPVTAEYFVLAQGKLNLSVGAGLGLTFFDFTRLETGTLRVGSQDIPKELIFEANRTSNKNPFYTSAHLEANLYLKTRGGVVKSICYL